MDAPIIKIIFTPFVRAPVPPAQPGPVPEGVAPVVADPMDVDNADTV